MPTTSILNFLKAFYPDPVFPGHLVIWTRTGRKGKNHSYWLLTLDEAADLAQSLRPFRDIYYGVALQNLKLALKIARKRRPAVQPPRVRGSEPSATALPALFADIDVAGPGHASGALPPDRDAALKLLDAVPVEPSVIVSTGGGFHVYWLFKELWILDSAEERARAKALLHKVQGALRAEARTKGWMIDHTADLARVLRLPGTLNLKSAKGLPAEPRPVTVERFPLDPGPGGDHRYNPSDFDDLPDPPAAPALERLAGRRRESHDVAGQPPADYEPMAEGCAFLEHCEKDGQELTEPEWYAMLGLAGRARLGDLESGPLCHKLSEVHNGYTPHETDRKLAQALASAGPATCRHIRSVAKEDYCGRCTYWGHIKSPIVLGRLGQPLPVAGVAVEPEPQVDSAPAVVADVEREPGASSRGVPRDAGRDEPEQIVVSTREHDVNDQALAALAAREPNLFERAGVLVHVLRPGAPAPGIDAAPVGANDEPANDDAGGRRPQGSAVVRPVHEARLGELLAKHCAFVKPIKAKAGVVLRPAHPPRWTARALLGRGNWPELPILHGVVECPVLRADGSVLQRAGYDAASGLVYAPSDAFDAVPDAPTPGQLEEALIHLREVVCNFPFSGDAHFAAWLSSLLTPLARAAFDGPSPLNLIDANVRGTGKSLLADVCATLLTGRSAPRMSYSNDEDELRKAITGLALEATQLVLIDNVSGAFGSPTLDRALTAETWRDRLLGTNDQVSVPLTVTWYATGNNVTPAGDTPRRCLHIRLESSFESPEKRTDFKHPRLLSWLRRERGRLLPAALTLLRGYVAAGKPKQDLVGWGSYESWSDLVRSCVVWLGLPDPAETREDLEAGADVELGMLHDLIHGMDELLGELGGSGTSKEILEKLAKNGEEVYPLLRSGLADLFPRLRAGELPRPGQFAARLRSYRGRIVRGACLDHGTKSYKGVRWAVRKVA